VQADGQNSPAYTVYSKIWHHCNDVVGLFIEKGEFHHFTVRKCLYTGLALCGLYIGWLYTGLALCQYTPFGYTQG